MKKQRQMYLIKILYARTDLLQQAEIAKKQKKKLQRKSRPYKKQQRFSAFSISSLNMSFNFAIYFDLIYYIGYPTEKRDSLR